jgi:membrane fusion protein (multidrug efflux system)
VAQIAVGNKVRARIDAFPDRTFEGEITAINPKIETGSRNVQVRATLPNVDQKLLPGMFATVELDTGAAQRLVTLPQTAVSYNPYGSLVYIVDEKGQGPDGKPQLSARQVFVTTGATRGDQVAILKGVSEGDTVVTSGQIKLRNGVPIVVNNSAVPTNDPAPKIVDK